MCVHVFDHKAGIRNCILPRIASGNVASESPSRTFILAVRSEGPDCFRLGAKLYGDVFFISVYLCILAKCKGIHKHTPVALRFRDRMLQEGENGSVKPIHLYIGLWMIRCDSEVLDF